ncbi:hypothetical protein [Streptomyces djakartensis]|uniref:hypothetical protein n=1 Tax=Streptomyces djakartensis TaxID=68193 RepID=UPI00167EF7E0|nr:hypothetical protein [Streptomyces djakartensis]
MSSIEFPDRHCAQVVILIGAVRIEKFDAYGSAGRNYLFEVHGGVVRGIFTIGHGEDSVIRPEPMPIGGHVQFVGAAVIFGCEAVEICKYSYRSGHNATCSHVV